MIKKTASTHKLIIKNDPHLLGLSGTEEDAIEQLENIDMDVAFKAVNGQRNYYRRLIFQAALAMFSASVTTYALGYYEALPTFKCK